MKCPICNQELEIKTKKVGETADGEAIYNEFAICHDCKKQWNLDKQRAKNESAPKQQSKPKKRPVKPDTASDEGKRKKMSELSGETPKQPAPKKKKKPEGTPASKDAVKDSASTKKNIEIEIPSSFKLDLANEKPVSKATGDRKPSSKKRPRPESRPERMSEAGKAVKSEVKVERKAESKPVVKKRPAALNGETVALERPVLDKEMPRPKKKQRPVKPAPRAMEDSVEEFSDALDTAFEDQAKPVRRKPIDNRKSEQTYSNIPPKHVRDSREKEMRENYQNMLDKEDEEKGGRFPVVLVVILIILILAAAAFAGYWFLLR